MKMTRTTWHPMGEETEIKVYRYPPPIIVMELYDYCIIMKPKDAERLANALLKAAVVAER